MRILAIGEAMIELAPSEDSASGLYRAGFAGDTLNTAYYLRACCPADWNVGYLTRLGVDTHSEHLKQFISGIGIDEPEIPAHPNRIPGLYMITLDDGERSFSYWRENSAARTLMEEPKAVSQAIVATDVIYLSGITLAILPHQGRADLLRSISASDARVAFDPNYRSRLWADQGAARSVFLETASLCDFVLPSFDDEAALFGDTDPSATAERYGKAGAREVVVKNGSKPGLVWQEGSVTSFAVENMVRAVDTTSAGDSFNAGYLSARLRGDNVERAVTAAQGLAAEVVSHRGALVPLEILKARLPDF